jgi:hypothetical protein
MVRVRKISVLVLGLMLCGCNLSEKSNHGVCSGVDCSGHGVCLPDAAGLPACHCDKGYHPEGLECLPDGADPCAGVTCSGYGACRLDDKDQPYCDCVEGYHAVGLYCVKDEPEPCDGIECSGHGTCYEDSFGKARCRCEAGYHEQGLECVEDGDCDPVALRAEALESGTVILKGVSLPASTEISKINANPESYADQHIQVEGLVNYACPGGNRVVLQDQEGNYFTVTADFNLNMLLLIEPGTYLVADGIYRLFGCRRGRHLNIAQHGARVGTIKCNSD